MGNFFEEKNVELPKDLGSYKKEDVIFLLKDVSDMIKETSTEEREEIIQGGGHYSEMLPIEYKPSQKYMEYYYKSMDIFADRLAIAVGNIAEDIYEKFAGNTVLVSLARAGTPFGILVRRYIKNKYKVDIPHYSVSIIRGKGIDENAMIYIIKNHGINIQFIDGWTGKGTIINVLENALLDFENKYGIKINKELAVAADPGYFTNLSGTREDLMIPSAYLNSTISGLISRTIHREDLIGENDFHGVKYYKEMIDEDLSNVFIDTITEKFVYKKIPLSEKEIFCENNDFQRGMKDIEKIKNDFQVKDVNFIKPGIGETTRVLLRRVPWKILLNPNKTHDLDHILILAKGKGVEVVEYKMDSYQCCGIIKSV